MTRYVLFLFVFLSAFRTLVHSVMALFPPLVFRKDLFQDYLMARGFLGGFDPYRTTSELGALLVPEATAALFPHPSPHPPTTLFLSLPGGFLGVSQAAALWLLFEIALLCLIARQAQRFLSAEGAGLHSYLAILVLLLGSQVVYANLMLGQFGLLLLVLFMAGILALRKSKHLLAGLALGVAFSIKFLGLPLFLFLILRKKWAPVVTAMFVFVFLNLTAALSLGTDVVLSYYTEVAPEIGPLYRGDANNQSLFTLGQRMWVGTVPASRDSVGAPPLLFSPALSVTTDMTFLAVLLLAVVGLARRVTESVAIPLAVTLSALASPVAWAHGLILCLPAVLVAFQLLRAQAWPTGRSVVGFVICLGLFMGDLIGGSILGERLQVSFLESMVTLIPMVSASALLVLVVQLEREPAKGAEG
jgi:hypothetical protein